MNNLVTFVAIVAVLGSILVVDAKSTFEYSTCPSGYTGRIANPGDCHSFYYCHFGIKVGGAMKCPSNLCFNPQLGVQGGDCDYCRNVEGCQSAMDLQNSVSGVPKCPPGLSRRIPDPDDCHSYYYCYQERIEGRLTCPADLCFNPKSQNCDYCENVECPTPSAFSNQL